MMQLSILDCGHVNGGGDLPSTYEAGKAVGRLLKSIFSSPTPTKPRCNTFDSGRTVCYPR
jgi:hypothetical protein